MSVIAAALGVLTVFVVFVAGYALGVKETEQRWSDAVGRKSGETSGFVSQAESLCERACKFNCDAESGCNCPAHQLYLLLKRSA